MSNIEHKQELSEQEHEINDDTLDKFIQSLYDCSNIEQGNKYVFIESLNKSYQLALKVNDDISPEDLPNVIKELYDTDSIHSVLMLLVSAAISNNFIDLVAKDNFTQDECKVLAEKVQLVTTYFVKQDLQFIRRLNLP